MNKRIINYVRGLEFHDKELDFGLGNSTNTIVLTDVQKAITNQNMEDFKKAFLQKAEEYIELHDNNGNNKIDFEELIELEEKDLGRKLTPNELKIAQDMAVNRFAILNQNDKDIALDKTEVATYLWAMSKINDGPNGKTAQDITLEEWNTTQESLSILSSTKLTKNEWDKNLQPALDIITKNNYELIDVYNKDISTLNLDENSKTTLEKGISLLKANGFSIDMFKNYSVLKYALQNGYEAFKNE